MIGLDGMVSIYLWTGYIDMRKGINGLVALAESAVARESMGHRLFIFCGKRKTSIKALEMDSDGWWLYQKRLVSGKFQWPKDTEGLITIDRRQLQWLLDGLSTVQPKAHANVLNLNQSKVNH